MKKIERIIWNQNSPDFLVPAAKKVASSLSIKLNTHYAFCMYVHVRVNYCCVYK